MLMCLIITTYIVKLKVWGIFSIQTIAMSRIESPGRVYIRMAELQNAAIDIEMLDMSRSI